MKYTKAFTLIELIMTISIMTILSVLSFVSYNFFFNKISMAAEVAAGRNLILAYQKAASDNNGVYLPSRDYTADDVRDGNGKILPMREMRARYPFRLAPYFNYVMEGTILVNKNKSQIRKLFGFGPMYNYGLSIFPAMGINSTFLGGMIPLNPRKNPNNECVTNFANSDRNIIAFVSAGADDIDGYEYIKPPYYWGEDEDNENPSVNGFVDFRFNKKAVVVFLNGSIKILGIKDLRDMRLWSREAAIKNDSNYIP
jgi:prepilin-type N-terminal cleavage/methylation domain-containing protein